MTENKYEVSEVPTQMGLAVIDKETNKTISDLDLLVKIANDIEEIKKNLVSE